MAKHGFKVFDSDMHVAEPYDLWQRYIDPAFRDRAPTATPVHPRIWGVDIEGYPRMGLSTPYTEEGDRLHRDKQNPQYEYSDAHWFDAGSQVRAMNTEGIDITVLFPTRALFVVDIDGMDPSYGDAIARAYNDWMYDFCQESPERMYGAACISPHDIEMAVSETRRCVEKLGFKAIYLRPIVMNGRNWYDSFYDPLWAECQSLGVPVCFHDGGSARSVSETAKIGTHFHSLMLSHTAGWHALQMVTASVAFCGGGVLARFPDLKVAFLEGNCSWVPWMMWRLDEHQEWRGFEAPELTMRPSEYFKRQCYVSIECDESPARYMDAEGYGRNVVFSTDYPHPDSKFPKAVDSFMELELSEDARGRYLWDNCARLYRFD